MQAMLKQTFDPLQKTTCTVLSVTGLSGGPGELPIFRDLALQLPAGVSALLGDEGVGKTSLMRWQALYSTLSQLGLQAAPCAAVRGPQRLASKSSRGVLRRVRPRR
jgi:ATPase subunit of ABC transporter with duplicated ATPase domains